MDQCYITLFQITLKISTSKKERCLQDIISSKFCTLWTMYTKIKLHTVMSSLKTFWCQAILDRSSYVILDHQTHMKLEAMVLWKLKFIVKDMEHLRYFKDHLILVGVLMYSQPVLFFSIYLPEMVLLLRHKKTIKCINILQKEEVDFSLNSSILTFPKIL